MAIAGAAAANVRVMAPPHRVSDGRPTHGNSTGTIRTLRGSRLSGSMLPVAGEQASVRLRGAGHPPV
jgi:hypothetical protein